MSRKEFWKPEEDSSGDYWRRIINVMDKSDIIDPNICKEIFDIHKYDAEVKYQTPYFDIYELEPKGAENLYFKHLNIVYDVCLEYQEQIFKKTDFKRLRQRYQYLFPYFWNDVQFYHYLFFGGHLSNLAEEFGFKVSPTIAKLYLKRTNNVYADQYDRKISQTFFNQKMSSDMMQFIYEAYSFIAQLYTFRSIAYKTWSSDKEGQNGLYAEETSFVTLFYPNLRSGVGYNRDEDGYPTDPFCLDINQKEAILNAEPYRIFDCIVKSMVADYVEEIMDFKRFKSGHNVARCHSCGQYFKYDIYARNRKYCSNQCKWREDKRRQRKRKKDEIIKKKQL